MSEDIDPMDATVSEDFDYHLGQLVTVEADGETYSLKLMYPTVTVVVGFHPEWVIEAVERDERFEVQRTTKEDIHRAQRAALGIEEPGEDNGGDA